MAGYDSFAPSQPSDLKVFNRSQILGFFMDGNAHNISDISAAIGVSRQTVMKSIQFFLKRGLLTSIGKGEAGKAGGKRPSLYTLSHKKYLLCVTLWPETLRITLFDLPGTEIDHIYLELPLPDSGKTAMDNVGQLIDTTLKKNNIPKEDLLSVSISTSGTIDRRANVLKYSSQSPQWGTDVPLADYLRPYLSPCTTIFLENACKMTARPYLMNPEYRSKRLLVLFSTWGFAGCLIENGHILNGGNSLIGEIGHMVIRPDDSELCGCGSRGCLERLVSAKRLRSRIVSQAANYPDSPLVQKNVSAITLPDIFLSSSQGDPLGQQCTDYLAETFATALRNVTLIFDPDIIIFQGDLAHADQHFTTKIYEYLHNFQYYGESGPFRLLFDPSDLHAMDTTGSLMALRDNYFSSPGLCEDETA